jgi:hypothetical protein
MEKEGYIKYDRGSDQITTLECPSTVLTDLKKVQNDIFKRYEINLIISFSDQTYDKCVINISIMSTESPCTRMKKIYRTQSL